MPFKLRWKKIDRSFPTYWPYSIKKKDLPQVPRGPDNFPLLIPSLRNKSPHALRYRDQVMKHEIEKIPDIHFKMYEFRKNLCDNFKINVQHQPRGSLPYWQYATQTRLLRGLPPSLVNCIRELPESQVNEVSDLLHHCTEDFLTSNSTYRVKHDDDDKSYVSQFFQCLGSGLMQQSVSNHLLGASCLNHDVEVVGLWGKDQHVFQAKDTSTVFHVRTRDALEEIVPLNSMLSQFADDIPSMPFNPELYETKVWENPKTRKTRNPRMRHIIPPVKPEPDIFPGFKVESQFPFVHTQFILQDSNLPFWLHDTEEYKNYYLQEVQDCHTLLNMFCTASSEAWFLGFTPYQDFTSPITCNAVVSDGKFLSFYVFQLNTFDLGNLTCKVHNGSDTNTRANILWSTERIPIFRETENAGSIQLNPLISKILAGLISQKTAVRNFIVPKSSWDTELPEGIPLMSLEQEEDPGYLKIKMRKPKNRDMRYYQPLHAMKKSTDQSSD